MAQEIITLTIEKLAGLGDGSATYNGRKVFVPYTLAGDTIQARIMREVAGVTHAALVEVLTPSPERIAPVCKHFGSCGGCALQHADKAIYADFKFGMAQAAVRKAGYDTSVVAPLMTLPAASRRRCELKVKNGKLGFYAEQSHALVDIEECHVLEKNLIDLILRHKAQLTQLSGLESVQINGVDGGYDVLLEGTPKGSWHLQPDPCIRRISISVRGGKKLVTIHSLGPVHVTLSGIAVEVPPGAFLQASLQAQDWMVARIKEKAHDAKRVLDLFAGIGTYSFALPHAQVTAIESNEPMVAAMQKAAAAHKLPLTAQTRDLFHRPLTAHELAPFDTVIINPPRAGAHAQCAELAQAKIPTLLMISCNPATFARDARLLQEGGYNLTRVTPIDQFVYSPHLELVAEFSI